MTKEYVLLNGDIIDGRKACLSAFDRGFLYGDGFFETMRAEKGRVLSLEAHLERLYQSCKFFNIGLQAMEQSEWTDKINLLIEKNNLRETVAAVKIVVTRGPDKPQLGLPKEKASTVIIYAREYVPPAPEKYNKGLLVNVFPCPRHYFLADHKSLNYLFYLAAREWAQKKGADEAIVLNVDGTVSEGATTNIFYVKEGSIIRPESPHYLRGVMEGQVINFLKKRRREIITMPTTVSMLLEAEEVFLTNSLIGIIPVAKIGETALPLEKPLSVLLQGVK
ncbi:MAG: aminotransferase class IV [Desulfovibrionales bacterium]|nr:aminotransferase class IV [Desulfovibrionales bacterium]